MAEPWYDPRLMLSINRFLKQFVKPKPARLGQAPRIVPRAEHSISRKSISKAALNVLYTLKDAGYEAYLVGGCVRDLLLGLEPKDFDVATNALPEEVDALFKRSRLIGRRFKLVHVRFGREVIEVATFRAPPHQDKHVDAQGRIMQDNVYGNLEQDAWRRDFTINALYYNIRDFSIVDYTGGMADLEAREITLIGDPETRYREDPVRMLRALRFVAKLGLSLSAHTEKAIQHCGALLRDIPPARLFDETLKLYLTGNATKVHQLLVDYGLFDYMYPYTSECLKEEGGEQAAKLIEQALLNTDARIAEDKPVTPAFLFAALLWPAQQKRQQLLMSHGMPEMPALQRAAAEVIAEQVQSVAVPKRFTMVTRDIWTLQLRLQRRQGKRAYACLSHPKFRAGYDFLLLRNESGEDLAELANWWTEFQVAEGAQQDTMISSLSNQGPKRPRRRRRRRPNAKKTQEA